MDALVGKRIREQRELKQLTQAQLAEMVGLPDPSEIEKAETAERHVYSTELFLLAEALGVSMQSFYEDPANAAAVESKSELSRQAHSLFADMKFVDEALSENGWK